ncbi:Pentatricopeptide repeat-containing protein [Capsicum baccatum]|uniref:Pentatricopeptide repeat-containing protein n=1 Tax=Capsicum baccatum TaxID=33114 RepID=A0A2G2V6Y2_CAPBA|nr:Pentatricopeptide repeat-containing protein [Capsicum baccatum]
MRHQGCSPNPLLHVRLHRKRQSFWPHSKPNVCVHFIKWGFEFEIYTLTALVDMYAKMGLLPSAQKNFDEMEMKDVPTWNSSIPGYAKNGNVEEAFKLFSKMPSRNVISLTAMICECSQNGKYADALAVYKEMEKAGGVKPNEVKIASVLPACANLGALEVGQKIEVYARASGYFKNMFVCNVVLEMYTKCVRIDRAMQLFHEIGRRRNLCSWNSMIMGLAIHGKSDEALKLFNQMLVSLCCRHSDTRSMGSTPLGSMFQGSHLWIQDLVVLGEQIRLWMIAWSEGEATFDDVIHGSIKPRRV